MAQGSLLLSTSGQVPAGGTASITLQNRSAANVSGELEFDPRVLLASSSGGSPGRLAFKLPPGGEQVFVLRVADGAAGQRAEVAVVGLQADAAEAPVALRVVGEVPAGSAEDPAAGPGECVRIMTGAALPSFADSVSTTALTAVSIACLTLYDMCKAVDRGMSFSGIRLVEKTGGRSGVFKAAPFPGKR